MENIRDGLAAIDPGHAGQYRTNAAAYITQIETVRQELLDAAASLPAAACITFHDSMTYLAEDLGLHPVLTLDTAAGGENRKEAWLDAMRKNAAALRNAA